MSEVNRPSSGAISLEEAYWALRKALHKIAAPKRPDGTYNLSREACELIANEALDATLTAEQFSPHDPRDVRPDCPCPLCSLVRHTLGTLR